MRAAVVILAAALVALLLALGIAWRSGRIAFKAEAKAETATDQAEGRRLEVVGERAQAGRVEEHAIRVRIETESNHARDLEARADVAARGALTPGVVARLRDADRGLCERTPAICADRPGPAPRAPGGGDGAVPADPTS